jgi:hypothetical protein
MDSMPTQKEITAIERGKRLRICRGYSGLNIKDFCKKYAFNSITFGRWEKGNKVSLNEKNVGKVCHALLKEGVICTPEWLLGGTGAAPTTKTGQHLFQEKDLGKISRTFSALLVFSEMEVFQDHNENTITSVVDSLAMTPFYDLGDYVGGIKLDRGAYELANNKKCLIKLSGTNKIILRNVQFSGNTIILTATNPTSPGSEPIVLDEQSAPDLIAPVIFHRKDSEWVWKKV